METRERLTIVVTEGANITFESAAPVASVAALLELKAVSMPRRSASNQPEKVAPEVHDLVRLVQGQDLAALAQLLTGTEVELAGWIGHTLVHWFADQRYTLARLRRLSNAVDAQTVDDDVLSVVAMLEQAVLDGLR